MSDLIKPQQPVVPLGPAVSLAPQHVRVVQTILAQQVPRAKVFAFGSRVSGNPRKYSDLDLAISLPEPLGLRKLRELKDAFEDSALPICVDVVDWLQAEEGFKKSVIAQGMTPLYSPPA